MEANYQALLTGDVAAFDALIQQLMSADNDGRKQAESLLEQLKQHSTDLVVGNLMRLMRQSQNTASRDMSAVMLRKVSWRICWVEYFLVAEFGELRSIFGCRLSQRTPSGKEPRQVSRYTHLECSPYM